MLMPSWFRIAPCLTLLGIFLSLLLPAAAQSIRLASAANPVPQPLPERGDSANPMLTPDGRNILFSSSAWNLTSAGTNRSVPVSLPRPVNVFLRDRSNGTTELMSVDVSGLAGGDANSSPKGLSIDGRYALFESSASNLVGGDTNGASDIFIRDRVNGATTLVSVNTNGMAGNSSSHDPVISPDGRFIAFTSAATDLVTDDTNMLQDVFVRDMQTGTTTLASVGATSTNPLFPVGSSDAPVLTPDGRFVVFSSSATNLVPGVSTTDEIYLRDTVAGTTVWVSTEARNILQSVAGTTNAVAFNHAISEDGRFVVYEACPNLVYQPQTGVSPTAAGVVLRYEVSTGATLLIHTNAANVLIASDALAITPDAGKVVFVANSLGSSGQTTSVLVWDAEKGATALASGDLTNGVPEPSQATAPVIDPTGRFVAFISSAPGLVTNTLVGDFHLYVRDLQTDSTVLVDADPNGVGSGVDVAASAAISSGGRFVAFTAADGSFVPQDRNECFDVFVRDLVSATNELISVSDPARPDLYPNGPSKIWPGSVSAEGAFIAFRSLASDLAPIDDNGGFDIFVRDAIAETNILISVNTNGLPGNGISTEPSVTADGRFVAFTSFANDLVPGITTAAQNVFVRDRWSNTTTLVSVNASGSGGGNYDSFSPVISADARFVLFNSVAKNLVSGVSAYAIRLYLRDLQTAQTYLLTRNDVSSASMTPDGHFVAYATTPSLGATARSMCVWDSLNATLIYTNFSSAAPNGIGRLGISPDGRRIACQINSGSTVSAQVAVFDWLANTNWTIAPYTLAPNPGLRFSADGRLLVYSAFVGSAPFPTKHVFLYDFETGTNSLVTKSYGSGLPANGFSDSPDISADGRFIAFRSNASDLVPGDNNSTWDIFLYDRQTGTTTLLTASQSGNQSGNNPSANPVFSPDGKVLVFESRASDLIQAAPYQLGNVFACNIFSSSSIPLFQVAMVPVAQGFWITWPAIAGKTYRVEFKDHLNDPDWQVCSEGVIIDGNQGSLKPPNSAAQRFFRVVAF